MYMCVFKPNPPIIFFTETIATSIHVQVCPSLLAVGTSSF